MWRRSALSLLLSLGLLVSSLAPAHAQEAPGLDGLRAAYYDLLDLFYRPIDGRDLLQAGWTTLSIDAPRRGGSSPGPLPDLPSNADAAFDVFAVTYSSYVASLPATFTAATAAADIETGMADSLHEQHTHYLSPAIMQRFLQTVGGGQQAVGLGIRLGNDPPGLITAVAPGGAAAQAGLQPGDLILNVDDRDMSNADVLTLSRALVGPSGSTITLTIDRGNGPQTLDITRGPYYFPPLDSRLLPDGVGYLKLSDFVISGTTLPDGTELLADLDRRLDDLDTQGATSLVLDLRGNGGGSL
jgi:C-terminal processing protease CtpA/Prc